MASNPGATGDWRQVLHPRVKLAAVVMVLWGFVILGRLVELQIVRYDDFVARALDQHERVIETPARRGEILDRDGSVLAYDVAADTVIAEPRDVENPVETVRRLCEVLRCTADRRGRLESTLATDSGFAYVARQVSPRAAERIRNLDLRGIDFLKENRRYYPNGTLAAHLLGHVGVDNQGLHGLESLYEQTLAGEPGRVLVRLDAQQQAFRRVERRPTAGVSLELTIDSYIQHIAERELRATVREHDAEGGSVVVLDPRTGDILALANEPSFNPNAWADATSDTRRNRATQDVYEPGSTFKIVTASGALEEQVFRPEDVIDVSPGVIYYGGRPIRDVRNYGSLTFADVIVKSSNVGTSQVGVALGADRLNRYVRRFGFGQTVSRDFPGESRGIVHDASRLREGGLARVSMGYNISVTPLQMAVAMNAVASGGMLMAPRLVRAELRGGAREEIPVRVVQRAIRARTAATLTRIMEDVVVRGTARQARIEGYSVAGKTGTAEKILPGGGYSSTDHVASFGGFVPSSRPEVTILVVVDGVARFGGSVAAPAFRRIGEAVLRHLGVAPDLDAPRRLLVPAEPAPFPGARPVRVRADASPGPAGSIAVEPGVMPDLQGVGARAALAIASELGLSTRLRGRGVVVAQAPAAGDAITRGQALTLTLERRPAGAGS
jgi:cell division protein FtsI (penicillin-binding protein 3)